MTSSARNGVGVSVSVQPLCSSTAFERVLKQRPVAKSAHFLLHYFPSMPAPMGFAGQHLSTSPHPVGGAAVDNAVDNSLPWPAQAVQRLGLILPKRHARRAVTRSLLRRQIKSVWHDQAQDFDPGDWVLRLRLPFDPTQFHSAASEALRRAMRQELLALLRQARQRAAVGHSAQSASGRMATQLR